MKILLILLLLTSPLYAQQIDTLESALKLESQPARAIKFKPYLIPGLFIAYGVISMEDNAIRNLDLSTRTEITEDHPKFAAHLDNQMQYAPLLAMYGLQLAGVAGKNSNFDQTAMALLSSGITAIVVTTLKTQTGRLRPDGSNYHSFPSGHTTTAFAAAELLNQEFKGRSPWIGYAGYTVATATGVLRTYNNKHWVSDVVAGAGIGIISTKITYLLYPAIKKIFKPAENNLTFGPTYLNKQMGYRVSFNLR